MGPLKKTFRSRAFAFAAARLYFKGSDLIAAIKQDEIEWYKGDWYRNIYDKKEGITVAACVLGIGVINLGIGEDIYANDPDLNGNLQLTLHGIINYNDSDGGAKTWEQARDFAVAELKQFADVEMYGYSREWNVIRKSS